MSESQKPRDPVSRLIPILRNNWQHKDFQKADEDLQQLALARDWPEKVPETAELIKRLKAFIESLPEKEMALKDADKLIEEIQTARKYHKMEDK